MKPADAARLLASGRDRRDRQRRGVARDQAIVADDRLQLREQGLLCRKILDDRLDHDVAAGKPGFLADHLETAARIARLVGRHAALAREHIERAGEFAARLLGSTGAAVEHADSHAGGRGDLRDAAAHGAGADDTQRKIGPVDINHFGIPASHCRL